MSSLQKFTVSSSSAQQLADSHKCLCIGRVTISEAIESDEIFDSDGTEKKQMRPNHL